MIGLSYLKEIIERLRFFSEHKSKLEKDHLFDIINNIQQGIFVFGPKVGLKFANKYAEDIFESIEDSNIKDSRKSSYTLFNANRSSISKEDIDFHLILEKKYEEAFINLFSKFKNVNHDLPADIFNFFTRFTKNNSQEKFSLEELSKLIENNPTALKMFTKLGNLKIDDSNSTDFSDYVVKEFEVHSRFITLDDETYIEFILSDISHIILIERKSTVNSCKANYLAKIAHEINNPLCSVLELSDEVIRESSKMLNKEKIASVADINKEISLDSDVSEIDFENINYCAKYISGICNFMNFLIQDFLLTSSFNEFCIVCEKTTNYCSECLQYTKCVICNMCDYCNKLKKNFPFNYNDAILNCVKVFITKNDLERNKISIDMNLNPDESSQKINNCQDYFNSILFNLFYHIYNKNKNNDMVINSKFINQAENNIENRELSTSNLMYAGQVLKGQYKFEIIETININLFKSSINSKIYTFEEYTKNKKITVDFEKLVHLYNAYILARKLGSDTLYIEVNEGGIMYTFYTKNHDIQGIFENKKESKTQVFSKFHLMPKKVLASSIKNKIKKDKDSKSLKGYISNNSSIGKKANIKKQRTRSLSYLSDIIKTIRIDEVLGYTKDSQEYYSENNDNKSTCKSTNKTTNKQHSNKHQTNKHQSKKLDRSRKKTKTSINNLYKGPTNILNLIDDNIIDENSSSSYSENQKSYLKEEVHVLENDSSSVKTEIFEDYKITHIGSLLNIFNSYKEFNEDKITEFNEDGKVIKSTSKIISKKLSENLIVEPNYSSEKNSIADLSRKVSKKKLKASIKPNQNILSPSKKMKEEEFNETKDLSFKAEQYFFSKSENIILRVLVADDERLIRNTINKFFLKYAQEYKLNIETVDCDNGMEGLYILHKYYKNKKQFDLIITDETMPYMKGSMMVNILLKLVVDQSFYKIPSISYTSYNDTEKMNYILSQGLDFIENKPISYSNFTKLMNRVLISNKK